MFLDEEARPCLPTRRTTNLYQSKMSNSIYYRLLFILLIIATLVSCKKEKLFVQPTTEIVGYSLREFPGDSIYLDIDVEITNNDDREVNISEIEYQVVVEGISSSLETVVVDQEFKTDEPLFLTLPLTVATKDALELFGDIETGEELAYNIIGKISFNDPILKLFDMPINMSGTAMVDIGYDEYFEQPEIAISSISADYEFVSLTEYRFNFVLGCMVSNPVPFDVLINEMEYVITLEGIVSEDHRYTEINTENLLLPAEGAKTIDLPISFTLKLEDALPLIENLSDGKVSYGIDGTIYIIEVNEVPFLYEVPFILEGDL